MDGAVRWVSTLTEENMSVTHLALLEPSDDPRPFCYLWSSFEDQTNRFPPILRMYSMLFERKYIDKNTNAYLNLEADPSLKFELELDEGNKITNLCSIIRDSGPEQTDCCNKRGEESLLLIGVDIRTLLFDLNQWYKEQMPHTVGECQNPNTFLSSYRTLPVDACGVTEDHPIDVVYLSSSLKEFPSNIPSPPEEFFFPNSLALQWLELAPGRIITRRTRGVQAELLREMSLTGPVILIEPNEMFTRCLNLGLMPFSFDVSFNSDKDVQRETLLSLCLEQRWSKFLSRCANDWSDGSAAYLFPAFIRWAMQRTSSLKLTAHRLCIPLFDHSGISLGEAEVKTLRFISQQIDCIANVIANLTTIETTDLARERRVLRRISTYLQVLLWFYDVGLLPESQEIDDEEHLIAFSLKIPYPYKRLAVLYKEKRSRSTDDNSVLFIDELVNRECPALIDQWEREGGELCAGKYPPSSLQSLLRSYLTDCHKENSREMENKHQITIYLLMDLAMLLQGSYPGVDQLIKYPSAFKLSPSLIKLTQALWLLDHEDYQGFLDMMTGQLVSDVDVKDWHHKLVLRTLIRNNQNKLALTYLRIRKPPLSSLDDQATVVSLTVEHGLVQSAFHHQPPANYSLLLTRFFQACKLYGKLDDILHLALNPEEEQAFVKFLENEKSEDTRLLYYLQRSRYAEASNVYPGSKAMLKGNKTVITMFNAYSATQVDIQKKFTTNVGRRSSEIDPDQRYPRPMSHRTCRGRTQDVYDLVMKKAKEISVRRDRSWIPFISAPCARRTGVKTIDTNCTIVKKTYGKRKLEEHGDTGDDRKRRKIEGDETPKREMGMVAAFDTPLVTRKIQAINARSTPMETPHSILKIRQMIRDSTPPSVTCKREEDDRKPRQIRFSIGQPAVDESMEEGSEEENNDEETTGVKSFSPNATEMKSMSETTILTDDSSIVSNVSGPRPRPSLRRSHFESQLVEDLRRRSLMNSVQEKMSRESPIEPVEVASVSIYSETILSSDTSFERTHYDDDKGGKKSMENYHESSFVSHKVTVTCETPVEDEHSQAYGEVDNCDLDKQSSMLAEGQPMQETIAETPDEDHDGEEKKSEDEEFGLRYDDDDQDDDSEEYQSLQNSVDVESQMSVPVVEINEVNITDDESSRFSACNVGDIEETLEKTISLDKANFGNEAFNITDDESDNSRDSALFTLKLSKAMNKIPEERQIEDSPGKSKSLVTREDNIVLEPLPTTRLRRASSAQEVVPELLESSKVPESPVISWATGRTSRSRRASSVDQEVVPQSLAVSSVTRRTSKTQRASSVVQEVVPERPESPKVPESPAVSSVTGRTSRTQRASSVVPEVVIERPESPKVPKSPAVSSVTGRTSRTQRASSVVPEVVLEQSESPKVPKSPAVSSGTGRTPRTQRASSVVPEVVIERSESPKVPKSPAVSSGTGRTSRTQRASSVVQEVVPELLESPELPESHAVLSATRTSRSKRASSVVQEVVSELTKLPEQHAASFSGKVSRSQRAKSVTNEMSITSTVDNPVKKGRSGRSGSLANEVVEELPVRRSSRRATSLTKDLGDVSKSWPAKITRASSKASLKDETIDEEAPAKKTRRKHATSVSEDADAEVTVKRSARARSAVKEVEENIAETTIQRTTRKRASSVPKETTLQTSTRAATRGLKRTNSVINDVIVEETDDNVFVKASSPALSTRSRLSSITSIPEEEDVTRSAHSRRKLWENKKTKERAVSDPSLVELKRTTRATLKSFSEKSIEDEDGESKKIKGTRKTSARVKRTNSATCIEDSGGKVIARRNKKISNSESTQETFQFSPPDPAVERPEDEDKGEET